MSVKSKFKYFIKSSSRNFIKKYFGLKKYKLLKWYTLNIIYKIGFKNIFFVGMNKMDKKIQKIINIPNGVFLEVGANDGISFSNTLALEKLYNWKGVLIEPVPELYDLCCKFRSKSIVVNAALGPRGSDHTTQKMLANDLHSSVLINDSNEKIKKHVEIEEKNYSFQPSKIINVHVRELSKLIDDIGLLEFDLMIIDVEGYEEQLLDGLDFNRHKPKYILIETSKLKKIKHLLSENYQLIESFQPHDYLFKSI